MDTTAKRGKPDLTAFARNLRRNMTDAERKMWSQLRAKRFLGVKFNRQSPVGPYITDFCTFEYQLVVEIDGGQHDEGRFADEKRTAFLESEGFRVIRFLNNDVLTNMEGVLFAVEEALLAQGLQVTER